MAFGKTITSYVASMSCPILEINHHPYCDYIHYISVEEMTAPIMKGQDCSGRLFFSVIFELRGHFYMNTFFKRYHDSDDWCVCDGDGLKPLFITGKVFKDCFQLIQQVLETGEAYLIPDIINNNFENILYLATNYFTLRFCSKNRQTLHGIWKHRLVEFIFLIIIIGILCWIS